MKLQKEKKRSLAEVRKLSSGARLVVEVMPFLESFSLGFMMPVGSAYESAPLSGMSHFIEHMLFKGTRRRNPKQIVQAIERVGGAINASTGRESTHIYCRVASSRLEVALDVLTDLAFNPLFDPEAIEKEKQVIIEEIKMHEDDPAELIFDRFIRGVHGNTGFGRPILGSEQTVKAFTPEMVWDFYFAHYKPSSLVVSIAGDVDPDKVESLLEKKLKGFRRRDEKRGRRAGSPKFKPSLMVYSKDVEQTSLVMGFPAPGLDSAERYAFLVLDAITAGGMMSRLFQQIREKRGLVYSIDSSHHAYSSGGLFTVEAGMSEKNLLRVLYLVLKEFKKLAEEGPGKRELADTKLYLKGNWALGLESSWMRMVRNAVSVLLFDKVQSYEEAVEELEAVRREDVMRAASKVFDRDGIGIAVLSRFNEEGSVQKVEEKLRETIERVSSGG